jgi:hypothetical protein
MNEEQKRLTRSSVGYAGEYFRNGASNLAPEKLVVETAITSATATASPNPNPRFHRERERARSRDRHRIPEERRSTEMLRICRPEYCRRERE